MNKVVKICSKCKSENHNEFLLICMTCGEALISPTLRERDINDMPIMRDKEQ